MIFLREVFVDFVHRKYNKEDTSPLFLNPTSSELRDLMKECKEKEKGHSRFVVLLKGNKQLVYMWIANILHQDVALYLDIPYPKNQNAIFGDAEIEKGKFVSYMYSPDTFQMFKEKKRVGDISFLNRKWVNPYVDITPLLDDEG